MHILFNNSRSCFLLLMASSVNTGLLIVTPISKQPSDVLTFGNNVSIIASSTMNFVMRCLVPPGDVNQLTINAGYRESTHNTVFGFNCSACAQPHSPHHKIHFKKGRQSSHGVKLIPPNVTRKLITEGVAAGLSLKRMVNLTTRCPQRGKE
ncbi:hypothetical protein ECDEC12B_1603 [Escherichia coli DEC12B]|nr:hypothetical protein ECDEC12B_1603 [Escherichia coli DEC12B]